MSGVIHWVPATLSVPAEVRLYDRLFWRPDPTTALTTSSTPISRGGKGARLEPSLAGAKPGSRWQLERVGYFVFDTVDSNPGAPVLNRTVTLRDSWQAKPQPSEPTPARKTARANTRPPKKSRVEYRAEARFETLCWPTASPPGPRSTGWGRATSISPTADRPTGDLFEDAVGSGAPPDVVARWVINELPRELGDRPLDGTKLTGKGSARWYWPLSRARSPGRRPKTSLPSWSQRGGDPRQIIDERGLAQVSDEDAIAAIVNEVLAANADKVDLYRAGKTGLFGFFVGQVLRSSQGKANPVVVQRLLGARLG